MDFVKGLFLIAEMYCQIYSVDDGEWAFDDGRDHKPWSAIIDSIVQRFKEVQQEARLINVLQ